MDISSDKETKSNTRKLGHAKKLKPLEKKWIFSDSSTEQRHKDKLCQTKNIQDATK